MVVENSLTRERVGLPALADLAPQIERWLSEPAVEGDDTQGGEHAPE